MTNPSPHTSNERLAVIETEVTNIKEDLNSLCTDIKGLRSDVLTAKGGFRASVFIGSIIVSGAAALLGWVFFK